MNSRLLLVLLLILVVSTGAAYAAGDQPQTATTASNSGTTQSAVPALKTRNPRYKLQKGDVLVLDFPFTPEFNATVTVQPDGFVSLRGVGDTHIEGLTLPEAQESLRTSYAKILHDPVITVTPQTFVSDYFIAYGELGKPGKYDLHGETTVSQAIGIAGGFTTAAKHSEVYLFRRVSDQWVSSQKLDVKQMLKSGNLAEDLQLQPGDMLYVPKNTVSKVLYLQPLIPYNLFRLNFGPF